MQNYKLQLFANNHVDCLLYGNFTKNEALKIGSLVELKLTNIKLTKIGNVPFSPSILKGTVDLHTGNVLHICD